MPSILFHDIIGHERALEVLSRMIEHDQLPHAFLFVGAHHIGKTTIARQLIQFLIGTDHPFMDVIELACLTDEKTGKKKSVITVEQVRDVCARMSLSAMNGGYKIAFIREANLLSVGAANALLKTLEEPTGKTLFILRAPSIESVVPTIVSRCQILRLQTINRDVLVQTLIKKGFDHEDAHKAAACSLGRAGIAIRYLTKSDERAQMDVGSAQARQLFSSSIAEQIRTLARLLPKEDLNKKSVADHIMRQCEQVFRDALFQKLGCSELMSYPKLQESMLAMSGAWDVPRLLATFRRFQEARRAIYHNTNPLLSLEHIFFSL